jgi:hypothetical protein
LGVGFGLGLGVGLAAGIGIFMPGIPGMSWLWAVAGEAIAALAARRSAFTGQLGVCLVIARPI